MSSKPPETGAPLNASDRALLLRIARDSIAYGLEQGNPLPVRIQDYPDALRVPRASFVTLHRNGQLRGCIGSLEAQHPLVEDVANNAYASAFHDPRFTPLSQIELDTLTIHISILQPAEALLFGSESGLLAQLRPGIDGLILQEGTHRATFLPSVWESLTTPDVFLQQLKLKAGLGVDYWSDRIKAWRYTTESFP